MSDLYLGIIAVSVLVMALIQVALIVVALRAVKRVGELTTKIEQDIRPLIANVQAISTDAARATALAATQVERADRLFSDLAVRLDDTLVTLQQALVGVTRGGAWVAGLRAVMAAIRDLRTPSRRRPSSVEEEDALFIG